MRAGVAIARGWADAAQVAMVPLADGGPGLGAALAGLLGGEYEEDSGRWRVRTADGLAVGVSPGNDLAGWATESLMPGASRLILDLTGMDPRQRRGLQAAFPRFEGMQVTAVVPSGSPHRTATAYLSNHRAG